MAHRLPSRISKMVLSIVKKGPLERARTYHLGRPRPPSQSSKMVLVSVHGGGPERTVMRTFEWVVGVGAPQRLGSEDPSLPRPGRSRKRAPRPLQQGSGQARRHLPTLTRNPYGRCYSSSKPLSSNLRVRLFSVTVRTTCSGVPSGMLASISKVSRTSAPTNPAR